MMEQTLNQTPPEALYNQYMPLVRRVAEQIHRHLPRHSIDIDSLIQSGFVGLLEANERYDAARGVAFADFARYRIRGEILEYLRSLDMVPKQFRRDERALTEAEQWLHSFYGRPACESELCLHLGWDLPYLQEIRGGVHFSSTDTSLYGDSVTLGDTFTDDSPDFTELVEAGILMEDIRNVLPRLSPLKRYVLEMTYLNGMSLRTLGAVLGFSEAYTCEIRSQAISDIKKYLGLPYERKKLLVITGIKKIDLLDIKRFLDLPAHEAISLFEKSYLLPIWKAHGGNISAISKTTGITRWKLRRRVIISGEETCDKTGNIPCKKTPSMKYSDARRLFQEKYLSHWIRRTGDNGIEIERGTGLSTQTLSDWKHRLHLFRKSDIPLPQKKEVLDCQHRERIRNALQTTSILEDLCMLPLPNAVEKFTRLLVAHAVDISPSILQAQKLIRMSYGAFYWRAQEYLHPYVGKPRCAVGDYTQSIKEFTGIPYKILTQEFRYNYIVWYLGKAEGFVKIAAGNAGVTEKTFTKWLCRYSIDYRDYREAA